MSIRGLANGVHLSLHDIKDSEYDYGEEKLLQINRNFQRAYEDINQIIENYFREFDQIFTREDLENRFRNVISKEGKVEWIRTSTPFTFLQTLYKIGFIGYFDTSSGRYIYSLEKPNMEKISTRNNLKIHDAFTAYLELNTQ